MRQYIKPAEKSAIILRVIVLVILNSPFLKRLKDRNKLDSYFRKGILNLRRNNRVYLPMH